MTEYQLTQLLQMKERIIKKVDFCKECGKINSNLFIDLNDGLS